jgi:predicted branched-subunit amino acid permease
MTGTATGYLAAPSLGDPRRFGLDLVLVLFFASTLTSGWRGPRDLVPWGAAALATRIPAAIVAPEWQVLVAALVGASVGAWRDTRR